ncbi:hypothetical protein ACFQ78_19655 [Streptomyces sp. NPDC056519]|uniref:hypothetical protein n=1 Tax=Streptomyces sp. NPDC056519 TaxID=3345849 RepID=UPI0036AEE13C
MGPARLKALRATGRAPVADRPLYAGARQNGIRAGYAQLATGERPSTWERTAPENA